MTTLRQTTSLWRRSRIMMLAAAIALGSVLAPVGSAALADSGSVASADGTSGASTFVWEGSSLSDATAIVSGGGQALALRAGPSQGAEVIGQIPHGTVVALRIAETDTVLDAATGTRWWPVAFDATAGWVSGANLADGTGLAPGDAPYEFPGGTLEGATATVRAGAGLRLRDNPNADAKVVLTIPNGTVVQLRIDQTDTVLDPDGVTRWWPVTFDGRSGWVSGYYLVDPNTPATTRSRTAAIADTAVAAPTGQFEWGGGALEGATAIAAGFGQNVNVRAEATDTSEIVAKVPDGSLVNLRIAELDSVIGPDGETRWWPVRVDGVNGWISGFYLTDGTTTVASQRVPGPTSEIFPAGSIAMVQTPTGAGLRLRTSAGTGGEEIGSLADRSQVTILRGPVSEEDSQNGWFEVRADSGETGFVNGDLLVLIATPVAQTDAGAEPDVPATTSVPTPASTEQPTSGEQTPTEIPVTPVARAGEDQGRAAETPTPALAVQGAQTPTPTQAADRAETLTPTQAVQQAETPVPTQVPAQTPTPQPTQAPAQSSSQFINPVPGSVVSQGFGCSNLGFYAYNPDWGCAVHDGIDFAAPSFTPILAVAGGTVVTAGWCDCGLGYYVEIDHGNSLHTIYGHMATQPYVSVGQRVSQGETIGPVGSTGLSTGPHVHFMVQVNGVTQDPGRYLP